MKNIGLIVFWVLFAVLTVGVVYTAEPTVSNYIQERHKESLSDKAVQQVFSKLIKGLPREVSGDTRLVITGDDWANAWAESSLDKTHFKVSITRVYIDHLDNLDLVAAVLAHELGHIVLLHTETELTHDSRINEWNADMVSVYILIRAGYDPCITQQIWKKILINNGDYLLTSSHPSHAQRFYYMIFPGCYKTDMYGDV